MPVQKKKTQESNNILDDIKKGVSGLVTSESKNKKNSNEHQTSLEELKKDINSSKDPVITVLESEKVLDNIPKKMIVKKKRRSRSFRAWLFNNNEL